MNKDRRQYLIRRVAEFLRSYEVSLAEVEGLMLEIKEWYAIHWRDDDNPKAEIRASREAA